MSVRIDQLTEYIVDALNEPSDIDASQTTITVDDGSKFPSIGNFLILIDSEIMRVTAVSGNDFTVQRAQEGTTGATHLDDAAVTTVFTPELMDNYVSNRIINYENRKAAMRMEDNTGAIMTESSWTWRNQGSATASDDGKGGVILQLPSEGSMQMRGKYISAPSTPYRLDAFCEFGPGTVSGSSVPNGSSMGLWMEESSTGEFVVMQWRLGNNIAMWKMNSVSSYNSNEDSAYTHRVGRCWLALEDNGTYLLGHVSIDGVNYLNSWAHARTSFMASGPNRVGFWAQSGNAVADAMFHFHALRLS